MAELKKYLFDNFVVEHEKKNQPQSEPNEQEAEDEPVEEVVEEKDIEEIKEQTFTEAEVEEKVRQAEETGFERGFKSANESVDAENNQLLKNLNQELGNIINNSCALQTSLEKKFAEMGKVLIQKVIPSLQSEYADKIISDFIKENFDRIKEEPKLSFYLHPDSIAAAQTVIGSLAQAADFEGKISLHKDDTLGRSDVRIEWDNGGVECHTGSILNKVTDLLDTN